MSQKFLERRAAITQHMESLGYEMDPIPDPESWKPRPKRKTNYKKLIRNILLVVLIYTWLDGLYHFDRRHKYKGKNIWDHLLLSPFYYGIEKHIHKRKDQRFVGEKDYRDSLRVYEERWRKNLYEKVTGKKLQ